MKIKKNVTVYKCDFCKKKLFMGYAMLHHEKYCESNPENEKACSMCKHLEETRVDYTSEFEQDRTSKAFRCRKLDMMLYPTIVERKKLNIKYPDTFEDQKPMPRTCEFFADHLDFLTPLIKSPIN